MRALELCKTIFCGHDYAFSIFFHNRTYHSEANLLGLWAMRKPTETRLIEILSYIFKTAGDGKSFVDGLTSILSGVVTRAVNQGESATDAMEFAKLLCG